MNHNLSSPKAILAIRPDRLGDVLLTTPAFQAIKRAHPQARLTVMVQPWIAPLLRGIPFVDDVLPYEPEGRHQGVIGFKNLVADLAKRHFDWAVSFQSQRKIAYALLWSGIPVRVGPWSKPHSWLLYNRGLRQHRSAVAMHEAEYNLQLLEKVGIDISTPGLLTHASIPERVREEARTWLAASSLGDVAFVAVHPGMGGSAQNWPLESYRDLVAALRARGVAVLLTGGASERSLLLEVAGPSGAVVYVADGRGVDFLGALFAHAEVVVAPSTGPLHLAVALGRRVVGLYPPIRVQSAKRWGPWGVPSSNFVVLTPAVECPEDLGSELKCGGKRCSLHPCMRSLKVEDVLEAVRKQWCAGT